MKIFRKFLAGIFLAIVAIALVIWLGPREQIERRAQALDLPPLAELEDWLETREAAVPNIRDGSQKHVVWAQEPGVKTPLSVVYLHGFSANREEVRPLPDLFAADLGANLFFTRLHGHGRDSAAMAEPRAGDWIADLEEALGIGRMLGDKVLVIGTSTGGTLAAWGAVQSTATVQDDVVGMVFVSPNFQVNNPAARLLSWPYMRVWGPLLFGQERGFEPKNAAQAYHFTTKYPLVSTLPMATLVAAVGQSDFALAQMPALFIFSDEDQVVVADRTREIAEIWGGPVTLAPMDLGPGIDPSGHVLAGDIISPAGTPVVLKAMLDWVDGLALW